MNKKILIGVGIVVVIILFFIIYQKEPVQKLDQGVIISGLPPINNEGIDEPLPQIIERAKIEGVGVCQELKNEQFKSSCETDYYLDKAKKENNVKICEELKEENRRNCKYQLIVPQVAYKYHEEAWAAGTREIVASNIELCELLENNEDKESCKNPEGYLINVEGARYSLP